MRIAAKRIRDVITLLMTQRHSCTYTFSVFSSLTENPKKGERPVPLRTDVACAVECFDGTGLVFFRDADAVVLDGLGVVAFAEDAKLLGARSGGILDGVGGQVRENVAQQGFVATSAGDVVFCGLLDGTPFARGGEGFVAEFVGENERGFCERHFPSIDDDGQTNIFEFTAGLIAINPASRFTLTLAPVPGQPTQKRAIFSPLVAGCTYTVEFRTSLTSGTWQPLTGTTQSDNGAERTITDTGATGTTKFYRVNVAKP